MLKLYDQFERKILIGNSKLQWLFESLHRFSLRGMNYDQVSTPYESGEVFVLNYIKNKLQIEHKPILFDVGANVGEYSKLLTTLFPASAVYSFEALPATFNILTNNINQDKRIRCFNWALGARPEKRTIYSEGAGSGLSTFYPIDEIIAEDRLSEVKVSTTTIDSFCQENGINKIDLLKIDVEGAELDVLIGAERMITERRISFIQFEFGKNHIKSGSHLYDFFKLLSDYNISRVLKNGLRPLQKYQATHEIYLSANYLAEQKNLTDSQSTT